MKSKFIVLLLILLCTPMVYAADAVKFSASAPSTVIMDRPFQLVYSVNASAKDLRAPEITSFEVLAGPFESHSSSYQIINGKQSSSVSVSYTYTLQPIKTGTFSIPSASIVVNGQKYNSNGLSIKVLPADNDEGTKSQHKSSKGADGITSENLFIKTQVSKTTVYEQEAILVTYKLYTLADVIQCSPKKMPDFNGFLKHDIEQPQNKQMSYESYNGRNYATVVMYQTLLYPQRTGVIEIDKINFDAVVRVQNKTASRSIFDDFFDSYSNITKSITASSAKVTVKALPANKPASFTGSVGKFTLNSSISTSKVKANEAVTIKVTLSGSGNMKLIKTPSFEFPDGFELYDPKITNNFKTTSAGVSGSKVFEFLFIPRVDGDFQIPAVPFSYFDTQSGTYKTLSTPTYSLSVLPSEDGSSATAIGGSGVNKEDVRQISKDIRYIYNGEMDLYYEEEPIFGSSLFWAMYLLPLVLSLALFFAFRKYVKENANLQLVKTKRANKVALKRLKVAQKFLKEGNNEKFYEEVLKASWTYLSDKLAIPVALLTKESVRIELKKMNIEDSLITAFEDILNTCEYARYAPNAGQQAMGNLYDDTIKLISSLEGLIKK